MFYQVILNFLHKITGNVGCKYISDAVQLYSDALLTCCSDNLTDNALEVATHNFEIITALEWSTVFRCAQDIFIIFFHNVY